VGFETTRAIAASSPNYHVIMGSRSLEKGQKSMSELQEENLQGSLSLTQLDVTDQKSISDAAAKIEQEFGRIDVLINNAGITSKATPFIQELREIFETNTFGPAIVTEAFLPLLEKSKDAHLVYVSSDLGSITLKGDESWKHQKVPAVAYRMSKAALNMLAMCHHVEYKDRGIKVFTFNPGFVVTNLTGEADRERRINSGAGDPADSARALLAIVDGIRDNEAGKHLHQHGVHPW
jgi:NAD(P)-dependent dehydrogenase (short-subunit alcohol dehydrogenase family)